MHLIVLKINIVVDFVARINYICTSKPAQWKMIKITSGIDVLNANDFYLNRQDG